MLVYPYSMRRILLAVLILMTTCIAQETTTSTQAPGLDELHRMAARFAPTPLEVNTAGLSEGDKKALIKLIQEASGVDLAKDVAAQ